jgi:hypothetical protein
MPGTITRKWQGLAFSKNSPLTQHQQNKLADEMRRGVVKIKGAKKKKAK